MVIKIFSDVVLDPVIRELNKTSPELEINLVYADDLAMHLHSFDIKSLGKNDILFIHSDQYFHRKTVSWQSGFLDTLITVVKQLPCKVLVSNSLGFGFSATQYKDSLGFTGDAAFFIKDLYAPLLNYSNVFFFDFIGLIFQAGARNSYNYSLGHLYQMPYSKPLIRDFEKSLNETFKFLSKEEKKVILVDCDNTLWSGIIGEDGIEGVICDLNADGILHFQLQQFLKRKKEAGFLLVLCTKNNYEDVKGVFDSKSMPLQWSDFILKKINWDDKWVNVKQVSTELNLGLSSFIFIDDNSFEVSSIKSMLPEIICFEFQKDYSHFIEMTSSLYFRRKVILEDDQLKHSKYVENLSRKENEGKFLDFNDFLKSLELKLDIRCNDKEDLERLSQLTGKTNQFNFNKGPYSENELNGFIEAGNFIYSLKLSDKFGEYGTVGLMLFEVDGDKVILENYLLSCRALGKRVEYDFWDQVMAKLNEGGYSISDVHFSRTDRNDPANKFYNEKYHGSKP